MLNKKIVLAAAATTMIFTLSTGHANPGKGNGNGDGGGSGTGGGEGTGDGHSHNDIEDLINNISLIPGPKGDTGDVGPIGPMPSFYEATVSSGISGGLNSRKPVFAACENPEDHVVGGGCNIATGTTTSGWILISSRPLLGDTDGFLCTARCTGRLALTEYISQCNSASLTAYAICADLSP